MITLKQTLPCIFILLMYTSISCTNESADTESTAMELTMETIHADDDLIALAESAAPIEISGNATIIDMEGNVLREGTNRWTCMAMSGEPMCLDEPWMSWTESYMNQDENVQIDRIGFSYMLRGDQGTSNIRPYVEEPTADNDWVITGPHLMLIAPDPSLFEGLPTDPMEGGPYIMWAGTPFEHVMIPIYPESVIMPYRED
jgi:hypothetical protein